MTRAVNIFSLFQSTPPPTLPTCECKLFIDVLFTYLLQFQRAQWQASTVLAADFTDNIQFVISLSIGELLSQRKCLLQ